MEDEQAEGPEGPIEPELLATFTEIGIVETRRAIEAILLVATDPTPASLLAQLLEVPVEHVELLCHALADSYEEANHGFQLVKVAGGWRFQTHPDMAPYVERFAMDGQSSKLSNAALETLAIVAYKQPISRAQVSAIRGVNVDAVLRTLVQRGYVDEVGRDTGAGQAVLFGTTSMFLERLGINTVSDLPALGDFVPSAEVVEALEQTLKVDLDPDLRSADIDGDAAPARTPTAAGAAGEGLAVDGPAASEDAATGATEEASPPEGGEPEAEAADGEAADGEVADGEAAEGEAAEGEAEAPAVEVEAAGEPQAEATGHGEPDAEATPAADEAAQEELAADEAAQEELAADEAGPAELAAEAEPAVKEAVEPESAAVPPEATEPEVATDTGEVGAEAQGPAAVAGVDDVDDQAVPPTVQPENERAAEQAEVPAPAISEAAVVAPGGVVVDAQASPKSGAFGAHLPVGPGGQPAGHQAGGGQPGVAGPAATSMAGTGAGAGAGGVDPGVGGPVTGLAGSHGRPPEPAGDPSRADGSARPGIEPRDQPDAPFRPGIDPGRPDAPARPGIDPGRPDAPARPGIEPGRSAVAPGRADHAVPAGHGPNVGSAPRPGGPAGAPAPVPTFGGRPAAGTDPAPAATGRIVAGAHRAVEPGQPSGPEPAGNRPSVGGAPSGPGGEGLAGPPDTAVPSPAGPGPDLTAEPVVDLRPPVVDLTDRAAQAPSPAAGIGPDAPPGLNDGAGS